LPLSHTEVHLFLETVHPGDLHVQSVAQLDDAAGAAPDDLKTGGVEDVKVVLQFRKRHQPAHGQPRHIDEKPEIPQVCYQRGVSLRAP
jgi:hypothetical protein